MCGIAGIANFQQSVLEQTSRLQQSIQNLSHRGPDYQNMYTSPHVLLGHSRLSIIDTSPLAHQPLVDKSKQYAIVFNGEIYNFLELRQKLEKKGYVFETRSDTEVLLYLYIEEGIECLRQLNGDFAFAIFDQKKQSLIVARDRFGIKPLYYTIQNHTLYFSSELKGLLPLLRQNPNMSNDALLLYLQLNYIPAPLTIYDNIYKLKPGHFIVFNASNNQIKPYYQLPQKIENGIDKAEAVKTFSNLLVQSVERRLISDVPIGCFLSGGLDSSIISAIAKQFKPDLNTFTISFKQHTFFDESPDAERVAKHLGTRHHSIPVAEQELLEIVPTLLEHLDEPFADSSAIAVSVLAKHTRNHITVALSGDGADELLGGYYKHTAHDLAFSWYPWRYLFYPARWVLNIMPQSRNTPIQNKIRQLKKFSEGILKPHTQRYWDWASFMHESEAQKLLNKHANRFSYPSFMLTEAASMHQVLLNDISLVLPNDMLFKTDSMSMMYSLEVRVPMLDHELVNYTISLPSSFKVKHHQRKIILKQAFGHLLSPEILRKPKHGFEVPMHSWLQGPLSSLLKELTEKSFIEKQQIFKYEPVRKLIELNRSFNPSDSSVHLWNFIVFQYWWKKNYL